MIEEIDVSNIDVPAKRTRGLSDTSDLEKSIGELGLLQPIIVRPKRGGRFELVAGLHRLTASRNIGLPRIPADVRRLDNLSARVIEIDENLVRIELTSLERGRLVSERQKIYEQQHPTTRRGGYKRRTAAGESPATESKDDAPSSFTLEMASVLEVSPRSVQRLRKIGDKISEDVAQRLLDARSPVARNKKSLIELTRYDDDVQHAIVDILLERDLTDVLEAYRIYSGAENHPRKPRLAAGDVDHAEDSSNREGAAIHKVEPSDMAHGPKQPPNPRSIDATYKFMRSLTSGRKLTERAAETLPWLLDEDLWDAGVLDIIRNDLATIVETAGEALGRLDEYQHQHLPLWHSVETSQSEVADD